MKILFKVYLYVSSFFSHEYPAMSFVILKIRSEYWLYEKIVDCQKLFFKNLLMPFFSYCKCRFLSQWFSEKLWLHPHFQVLRFRLDLEHLFSFNWIIDIQLVCIGERHRKAIYFDWYERCPKNAKATSET